MVVGGSNDRTKHKFLNSHTTNTISMQLHIFSGRKKFIFFAFLYIHAIRYYHDHSIYSVACKQQNVVIHFIILLYLFRPYLKNEKPRLQSSSYNI